MGRSQRKWNCYKYISVEPCIFWNYSLLTYYIHKWKLIPLSGSHKISSLVRDQNNSFFYVTIERFFFVTKSLFAKPEIPFYVSFYSNQYRKVTAILIFITPLSLIVNYFSVVILFYLKKKIHTIDTSASKHNSFVAWLLCQTNKNAHVMLLSRKFIPFTAVLWTWLSRVIGFLLGNKSGGRPLVCEFYAAFIAFSLLTFISMAGTRSLPVNEMHALS